MALIIVDTSSILFGMTNRRSVFESIISKFRERPIVSKGVIRELSRFASGTGRRASSARAGLEELKAKDINIYPNNNNPDKWLLSMANRHRDSIIITNDTALARRLTRLNSMVYKMSREGILKRFE